MIDCHCHILPGIDDGSPDIATSLSMLRAMQADGVAAVVATPHIMPGVYENSANSIVEAVRTLSQSARDEGLDIEIMPGAEHLLTPDLPRRLDSDSGLMLPGGRAVLIELPMYEMPPYAASVINEIATRGTLPILAHPERNAYIAEKPERVQELIVRGAVLQVNAGSFSGLYGKQAARVARTLIKNNNVFLIASDAHGMGNLLPLLSTAFEFVAGWVGAECAQMLTKTNPAWVVNASSK